MNAPIPIEEKKLLYDYIYNDYLLEQLDQDRTFFEKSKMRIPDVYENLMDDIVDVIGKDLRKIQVQMREKELSVEAPVQLDDWFIEYVYHAHGYYGTFRFWKSALNLEANKRLEAVRERLYK
ncbi:hypothetical protein LC087_16110 [Bacillus carboniphilus]|uniref:Uncharacterized protein n=1 Tax=Bacillus carboniphilus TaxID=86663 RepID=A0ABY9JSB8_9BACI|nr:hypothetical protein [Bacillus carboniphilus]WLR42237.1 hypothetical protein LC087_16110 [Bacillus carboniphilus]